jgi:hypothetical protein
MNRPELKDGDIVEMDSLEVKVAAHPNVRRPGPHGRERGPIVFAPKGMTEGGHALTLLSDPNDSGTLRSTADFSAESPSSTGA